MTGKLVRDWLDWLGDGGIVAIATFLAFLAHDADRPITAVLLHLFGVLLVSARSGQLRGILAALLSFLAYLFLAQPAFTLSTPTGDTLVPLFAFLFFAIVVNSVVGRLRDNAAAAQAAERKSSFLLALGDRMQSVLQVSSIEEEMAALLPSERLQKIRLYVYDQGNLVRPARGNSLIVDLTGAARDRDRQAGGTRQVFLELRGSSEALGVVDFTVTGNESAEADLRPVAALLALTVERCLLLEKISEVQAAKRTEALKDAILSSVSHDLRTPLTAIDAAASALGSPDLRLSDQEREKLLVTITDQCDRLNRYTGDLLDMGRIQAGISPDQFETVELAEILAVVLQQVRDHYPSVTIDKDFGKQAIMVRANASMLQQALFNLVENAVKHGGDEGRVQLSLSLRDEQALVAIEDEGPGIPPSEQGRVFERFHRLGGAGDKGGSGLGLYIANGFIAAFGGRIALQSPCAAGGGTRVTVSLPATPFSMEDDMEQAQ